MKCSISGCPNFYEKKGQSISFHRFPNNPKILTAWVAATGTPNFIPTHYSKICSAHFDESAYLGVFRKLKPESVPTKLLPENATRIILEYLRKEEESNPVACILGADTPIKQVTLVRDNVPPRAKSITVSMHSQPPPLTPAPASTIKVVDMKKLLQPQAQPHATVAVKKGAESQVPATSVSSVLNSLINKYTLSKYTPKTESSVNRTGIKASQVLTCLRIILPGKFDLSRMIPNEKVASLVIRYLKLDETNEEIQNVVKEHLKIIIEAVKTKDKRSLEFTKHPYAKISDRDLKRALALILPENFSMIDITDELLGLICITLNLDIHTDAYYILIRKIRKFTSEGQKFNEILNRGNKVYDDSLEVEKDLEVKEVEENVTASQVELTKSEQILTINDNPAGSEVDCVGEQRRELVFVDVNNPAENSQESVDFTPSAEGCLNISPASNKKTVKADSNSSEGEGEKIVLQGCKRKNNSGVDSDWDPENENPNKMKIPEAPQLQPNVKKLKAIVSYLHEKKCSVKDVLADYQLMFDMCRHVQIRLRNSNLKDVESQLNYIVDNKINVNNVKDHLQQLSAKQLPKQPQRLTSTKCLNSVPNYSDEKLKMKPIVVIQDLLDYKTGQLLFMKKKKVKSNGFYKQIPFSLKQNLSNQKYSTEQVRKLTDDSYKQFRRIVLKRNGTKGVFQVKYAKLNPGTVVYAKNFRHPGVGWVKGVVSRPEGPLKYQVKLDNDSLWCCTVDQLRPLLSQLESNGESQRSHRPVKPKQLFDL